MAQVAVPAKYLETCTSRDSAETSLTKIKSLIDEGRWLQKKKIANPTPRVLVSGLSGT